MACLGLGPPELRMIRYFFIPLFVLALAATACGGGSGGSGASSQPGGLVTLRLGYFPNMTHAQPQVGLARGTYAQVLGSNVTLDMSKTFNAGPAEMEALLAGSLDAAYVGPSPAINTYLQTNGKELRIVAGATSAGALLIVRPESNIQKAADFANKKIASPQLGNTQDIALRTWLRSNGLNARDQGGNVTVIPSNNADTLTMMKKDEVDGAWVPEPWATRLLQEAGGKVFLDERSLWPGGQFDTTVLVVRKSFLDQRPDVVESLIKAQVETTAWIKANPDEAKTVINHNITKVTGAGLSQQVIDAAWKNQDITDDPIVSSLQKNADAAFRLGFLGDKKPDLKDIVYLDPLNKVLKDEKLPEVKS
jgi:NitT/TauT family transport system substrate-binding protein